MPQLGATGTITNKTMSLP